MAIIVLVFGVTVGQAELAKRWVYCAFNLWVDENIDDLEGIMRRPASSGYNGILLADSKFGRLSDMDAHYFCNIECVKRLAAELKLEIVPEVFLIGYSENLLCHDPNLAEGLPVRDALFAVRGGVALVTGDPSVAFRTKWDWKDDTVTLEDGAARDAIRVDYKAIQGDRTS